MRPLKRYLLLFTLLQCFLYSEGQRTTYPVQVNVNLIPPYSLYLSDYVSGGRDRIMVTLLNRDLQYPSMPVRLRLTIKGAGFSVQSKPYSVVTPLLLDPNVPYRVSADELLPYFDRRNLTSQGLGSSGVLRDGRLPEGMAEFCIEVLEHHTSRVLSQGGCGIAWLQLQEPPLQNLPFDGAIIDYRDPLNLLFQWTPRHSAIGQVEYELIIKEIRDNGLRPEASFAYSPEIFRERVQPTSFLYGASAPALLPGTRYMWAVRAVAKEGIEEVQLFENSGQSTIRTFQVADYCPVPQQIEARAGGKEIILKWQAVPEHRRYEVSYREEGKSEWHYQKSVDPAIILPGVRAGYRYEYRVGAVCSTGEPFYGPVHSIFLLDSDSARMANCGILKPIDLSNQSPLEVLLPGDRFMAGDFPMYVKECSGGSGIFSGTGYTFIPFLGGVRLSIRFDGVFINSDYRLLRGYAEAVYDRSEKNIYHLDNIFSGGDNGKVVSGLTQATHRVEVSIDSDTRFTYDESTGTVILSDGSNAEVGSIDLAETAEGALSEGEVAKETESKAKAPEFPVTVQDGSGTVYRIDRPDPGSPDLTATPIGKSGGTLPEGSVDYKRLDIEMAIVTFGDAPDSRYGFDRWRSEYAEISHIGGREKYERLGQEYYVPWKLLPSGRTDRVTATIRVISSGTIDPKRVVFRTPQGMEFSSTYDSLRREYSITLTGGAVNDGQEVYALHPRKRGGYYNLGKLCVASYPEQRYKVRVVPVNGEKVDVGALRSALNEIYNRYGISWEVEEGAPFRYEGAMDFFDKKSSWVDAYGERMKSFQSAYLSDHPLDGGTSCIFVFSHSGGGRNRDASGFMPRGKQFCYLFAEDFSSLEEFHTAAAHELGHGRLQLLHTFSATYGERLKKSSTDNLMDYANGRQLAKWQWDYMYDPGVVVRIFERDEDALIIVDRNKNSITIRWSNCQPQMVANKKLLLYDAVCADTKENVTYYRLVNNGGIVADYLYNSSEVINKYSITIDKKEWFTLSLSDYPNDCLSCELIQLLGQMTVETGKLVGTYVIPAEDVYILVTGEDFDREESSRIAAGGFLILEVVQVGKVVKLMKGGKILTKTGKGVDISARVFKQFAKKTAEDAVIDLSTQFLFGFSNNAILYPNEDGYEITKRALLNIKLQDAVVAGMIDYASLSSNGKMAFECALKMTSKFADGGCSIELTTVTSGIQDCLVNLIISVGFKHLKGTAQYNVFYKALQDTRNYDIILKKLSDIVSKETVENFIQALVKNGIQNTYGK